MLALVFFVLCIFIAINIDKKTNPTIVYLEDKFHHPKNDFLIQSLDQIPSVLGARTALVLGADVAEKNLIFPLKKGYGLIAVEGKRIYYELLVGLIPNGEKYRNKVKIIRDLDTQTLPPIDLIMADFFFSFYPRSQFLSIWNVINTKLKKDGYFVGNFFDPSFETFDDNQQKYMSFFTKYEVLNLFKDFEIIKIKQIKKKLCGQNGVECYWEVFAKKTR